MRSDLPHPKGACGPYRFINLGEGPSVYLVGTHDIRYQRDIPPNDGYGYWSRKEGGEPFYTKGWMELRRQPKEKPKMSELKITYKTVAVVEGTATPEQVKSVVDSLLGLLTPNDITEWAKDSPYRNYIQAAFRT